MTEETEGLDVRKPNEKMGTVGYHSDLYRVFCCSILDFLLTHANGPICSQPMPFPQLIPRPFASSPRARSKRCKMPGFSMTSPKRPASS